MHSKLRSSPDRWLSKHILTLLHGATLVSSTLAALLSSPFHPSSVNFFRLVQCRIVEFIHVDVDVSNSANPDGSESIQVYSTSQKSLNKMKQIYILNKQTGALPLKIKKTSMHMEGDTKEESRVQFRGRRGEIQS